jgi:hypothetical protein
MKNEHALTKKELIELEKLDELKRKEFSNVTESFNALIA